ncbi:MAG: fluoride efflux transporter FluC [Natronomonas sp.]
MAAGVTILAVGLGGLGGAMARYAAARAIEKRALDTLLVNVVGSFLLGVILVSPIPDPVANAAGVGFCGALTTFSSFAVETVRFVEDGKPITAVVHAVGTLAVALLLLLLGIELGQLL